MEGKGCKLLGYVGVSLNGGKTPTNPWGFPTKNDHFGVFWGYHHFFGNLHIPGTRMNDPLFLVGKESALFFFGGLLTLQVV